MRRRRLILGVLLTVVAGVGLTACTRCRSIDVPAERRLAAYDVEPYRVALAAGVRDGLVDYHALRSEAAADLDRYLDAVARFGPGTTPEAFAAPEAALAYSLNAYNAIMLRRWLDAGAGTAGKPDDGRVVNKLWFVFDLWRVDGKWVSLDTLEQRIIRPRFGEPRVHFALVCGARGCPPLLAEPFDATRLDAQLDALGRRWLLEPDGLEVRDDGRVLMSRIFEWYRVDFDRTGGLAGVLDAYLAPEDPRRAPAVEAAHAGRIGFPPYDWSINRVEGAGE